MSLYHHEFDRFQKNSNIKWLQKAFYIHRPLAKQFMKHYNPDGIKIENLVKDKARMKALELARQELGENAKEKVKRYDSKIIASKYFELYKKIYKTNTS